MISGWWSRNPLTSAATDWACARASTTSSIGQPYRAAIAAVQPGATIGDVHDASTRVLAAGLIDLGVVSGFCDRINVMYGGKIVESGPTKDIFYNPQHPYNRALQNSIPALQAKGKELYTIPGMPPDMSKPSAGCSFAPRCEHATELCTSEPPELKSLGQAHPCARVGQRVFPPESQVRLPGPVASPR